MRRSGRNPSFVALLAVFCAVIPAATPRCTHAGQGPVHLNQFGFLTEGRKWAAVPVSGDGFEVRRHASHEVVFSGPLQLRRAADPASGQDVWEADFSALTEGGWYYLRVPRVGDSPPFLISDDIYDRLFRIAVQGLYYQRCGTAIGPIYGGQWQHDECHAAGPSAASYHWST
ncbi:MAG: cellulase N-terminal Ig-like domain-containing protein, partial [Gemmatimonadota bacterium]|nr:cellulase N-terminal Ig-like domain-containing protein [Gemmatimonadota bacterium]